MHREHTTSLVFWKKWEKKKVTHENVTRPARVQSTRCTLILPRPLAHGSSFFHAPGRKQKSDFFELKDGQRGSFIASSTALPSSLNPAGVEPGNQEETGC